MNKKITTLILALIVIISGSVVAFNFRPHAVSKKINTRISSILVKLSPEEITKQSDVVIVGTVKDLKTLKTKSNFWSKDDEDIVTNANVEVEKYLFNPKNLSGLEIIVQTIGGTIGNETMFAEDEPKLEKGQRVIVFLRQAKNGAYIVFGGPQGAYTINGNNVAVGEKEQNVFSDVFGKQMALDELEKQISTIVSSSEQQK
ncbi:MAG: hypothetical protein WC415_00580 [Patescibacteria group bacterium]|jgi:hypothetical protein